MKICVIRERVWHYFLSRKCLFVVNFLSLKCFKRFNIFLRCNTLCRANYANHFPQSAHLSPFFSASKSVPQVAMTTAGNLPSKKIIHVALTGPDKVKKMTKEILQMAEKSEMQSVAFPALGTGTCKIQKMLHLQCQRFSGHSKNWNGDIVRNLFFFRCHETFEKHRHLEPHQILN